MLKHTLTAAALATVIAAPAYAQSMNSAPASQPPTSAQSAPTAPAEKTAPPMKGNSSSAMPAKPDTSAAVDTKAGIKQAGFVQQQESNEWRSSKLVGASVYGPDNKSIGSIDDLILDQKGGIKAAVIGVGGFLGVGQKDVAVPFDTLQIQRKANSSSIDKITVSYTKDQLTNAPKFSYYQVQSTGTTTGMGGSPTSSSPMTRPTSPPPAAK